MAHETIAWPAGQIKSVERTPVRMDVCEVDECKSPSEQRNSHATRRLRDDTQPALRECVPVKQKESTS